MKELIIEMKYELKDEDKRLLTFVSDKIESFEINKNRLLLNIKDDAETSEIRKGIDKILSKSSFVDNKEVICAKKIKRKYASDEELFRSKIIKKETDGCISFSGIGVMLFDFFDTYFSSILCDEEVNCVQFPTLLNVDTVARTNYFSTSPQYMIFCSKVRESMDSYENLYNKYVDKEIESALSYPQYSLSPSACFHLYQSIQGKVLEKECIFTMRQNVFRNEGRLNWSDIERLQDYHVREIVMIGAHNFVYQKREKFVEKSKKLLDDLNLSYSIEVATDPFVLPIMQRYKKIQFANKVKYEMKLNTSPNKSIACGSFNFHGTAFSDKFGFSVLNTVNTESGCIGFGIERLIIAFLKQYGVQEENWPKTIKEYIHKERRY